MFLISVVSSQHQSVNDSCKQRLIVTGAYDSGCQFVGCMYHEQELLMALLTTNVWSMDECQLVLLMLLVGVGVVALDYVEMVIVVK